MRRAPVLALSMALALGGCALTPAQTGPVATQAQVEQAWEQRMAWLGAVEQFQLQGRLAVKGEGLSGSLRWRQDGRHFNLRLAGPLGAGALVLDGDEQQVAIRGKDIDLTTTQPEQVLAARTGWLLPLQALRWWVLGIPSPDQPARVQIDAQGRALGFSQLGWQLSFGDYPDDPAALPGRIEARKDQAQATVIIESLRLGP